ncbi:mechanosensitive ion channel family protein [Nitratireductor sp. GCM10026969]|uniref:mechanosensitive ion channel family protein n=1 Tax=Nitratireductor sp. GCM10026969 TaxID=3252645 RepID=UPI00361DE243
MKLAPFHAFRHLAVLVLAALALPSASPAWTEETSAAYPYLHQDLTSPRATLETFRSAAAEAGSLVIEAHRLRLEEGGLFASRQAKAMAERAEILIDTAAHALDLSRIPPAILAHTKVEVVLQLEEVLDRVPLPETMEFPDLRAVREASAAGRPLLHWRVPDTGILIVQQNEESHAGEFAVSAGTVDRISTIYKAVHSLPSRSGSADAYALYSLSPGRILPPVWYVFIHDGPEWLTASIAGNAVWQWLALVLWTAAAGLAIALAVKWRWRHTGEEEEVSVWGTLHQAVLPLVLAVLGALFLTAVLDLVSLTGTAYFIADAATQLLIAASLGWLAVIACRTIAELIIKSPSILPGSLDAHLLRAGFRVLGLALAVLLWSHTAAAIGIPLFGVLAGLGIGGLAIALAAQPTIENFIGGVILFADRPARTGDFCRCGDILGTVEEIGIRSTRIRALDRTLVSIPNSEFAKERIVNYTRRDQHMFDTVIGIRLDTTDGDFQNLLARLHQVFEDHPLVIPDMSWVRFRAIRSDRLEIHLRANLRIADYDTFLLEKGKMLLSVKQCVEASGCAFALPARRLHPADPGGAIISRPERDTP